MIDNVVLFLKHLETKFLSETKLKHDDYQALKYELRRLVSDVHRGVAVHQQKVLRKKTGMEIFQIYLFIYVIFSYIYCDIYLYSQIIFELMTYCSHRKGCWPDWGSLVSLNQKQG